MIAPYLSQMKVRLCQVPSYEEMSPPSALEWPETLPLYGSPDTLLDMQSATYHATTLPAFARALLDLIDVMP